MGSQIKNYFEEKRQKIEVMMNLTSKILKKKQKVFHSIGTELFKTVSLEEHREMCCMAILNNTKKEEDLFTIDGILNQLSEEPTREELLVFYFFLPFINFQKIESESLDDLQMIHLKLLKIIEISKKMFSDSIVNFYDRIHNMTNLNYFTFLEDEINMKLRPDNVYSVPAFYTSMKVFDPSLFQSLPQKVYPERIPDNSIVHEDIEGTSSVMKVIEAAETFIKNKET